MGGEGKIVMITDSKREEIAKFVNEEVQKNGERDEGALDLFVKQYKNPEELAYACYWYGGI